MHSRLVNAAIGSWCLDKEFCPESKFSFGALQLEEVHWLEGLGPAPDSQHNNPTHGSFAEMVSAPRLILPKNTQCEHAIAAS